MVYLEQGGHCPVRIIPKISYKKARSTASIDQKQSQSARILTSAAQMGCNLFFVHTEVVDSPNIIR